MADSKKKLLRQQLRARDAEIALLIKNIEKALKAASQQIVNQVNSGITPNDALVRLSEFERVLQEAGLQNEVSRIRKIYANELLAIKDQFNLSGVEGNIYSGVDRDIVETLITSDINKISNKLNQFGVDLKAQVARAIIAGQSLDLSTIDATPKLLAQMQTELDTGFQSFNRTVTVKKATDLYGDNPKFEYIGPDDNVTRDFCRNVLRSRNPPVYTLSEINAMDNGQINPVFANGGGYNCRHGWFAVDSSEQG